MMISATIRPNGTRRYGASGTAAAVRTRREGGASSVVLIRFVVMYNEHHHDMHVRNARNAPAVASRRAPFPRSGPQRHPGADPVGGLRHATPGAAVHPDTRAAGGRAARPTGPANERACRADHRAPVTHR